MGLFDYLQKPGAKSIKQQPLKIRKEVVKTKVPPIRTSSASTDSPLLLIPNDVSKKRAHHGKTTPILQNTSSRKHHGTRDQVQKFSSDESDMDDTRDDPSKRSKSTVSQEPDLKRHIRLTVAFSEGNTSELSMVHAADITSVDTSTKFVPAWEGLPQRVRVLLQYPTCSQPESYYLVKPQFGDDNFEPLQDMIEVMRKISENYLPPVERNLFDHETSGFPQRLSRAIKRQSEVELKNIIEEWNRALQKLRDNGVISQVLDSYRNLDPGLVEHILTQTYSRIVSPRVSSLREYENGTDNVYGELLPKFVSKILHKDASLKSDQVFIDLGSGVGNVVLQSALEIGCESWGCEMMKNACDLAELQRDEFQARCRLWGLVAGQIVLERGDFLSNAAIGKVLKRADVVLVNNQAFTPGLNEGLTRLFLDLKEGCRVISLKSFVPAGHKITARNLNSPYNVLKVEQKEYYSDCVSWTNAPGTYYVSTKDSRQIKAFAARNK